MFEANIYRLQYISPRVDYFKCISEDVQNWGGGDPEIFFEEGEEAGRVLPGLACSPSNGPICHPSLVEISKLNFDQVLR